MGEARCPMISSTRGRGSVQSLSLLIFSLELGAERLLSLPLLSESASAPSWPWPPSSGAALAWATAPAAFAAAGMLEFAE
eukprot:5412377-Pyramimonas_sp.AAC.1